jgi:hypothetical protein
MLTHTRTLPPYAHPALTPYSVAGAKAWGEFMKEVKIETSRAEAFVKDAVPWGTGFDPLGVKSSAGVNQVAQLRIQLRKLNEVKPPKPTPKPTPTTEPTPKPPRGEKRLRSPDDDEDLDALDESPDSAKDSDLDVYGRQRDRLFALATELAQVKAAHELQARVRHEPPTPHVPSTWPNNPYSSPTTSSTRLSFSTRLFLCPRRGLNPKLHRLGPLSRLSRQRKRSR